MDFVEALSKEILDKIVPPLADAVTRDVIAQLKQESVYQYSEEEAAGKLGISPAQLAKCRKDKEIEFSYSILPTFG